MSIEHGVGSTQQTQETASRNWRLHRHDHDRAGTADTARIDNLTFWDVLDVFNPLQHIPLLSVAYREITGDAIHPSARVLGGALYGGPLGMMSGAMNAAFEQETGRDIPHTAIAALRGQELGDPAGGAGQLADAGRPAHDRPLPALDLAPVAGAVGPAPAGSGPGAGVATAPASVVGPMAEAPALPRFDLAPRPGGRVPAIAEGPVPQAPVSGGPVRVDGGMDAALRALAANTGAAAPTRSAADATAAYRTRQSAG